MSWMPEIFYSLTVWYTWYKYETYNDWGFWQTVIRRNRPNPFVAFVNRATIKKTCLGQVFFLIPPITTLAQGDTHYAGLEDVQEFFETGGEKYKKTV